MSRTIITHVGTSALRCQALLESANFNPNDLDRYLQSERSNDHVLEQTCREDLIEGLRDTWQGRYSEKDRRMRSPAEIASLSMLKPQRDDRVVLLHPQSAGGAFCANLIAAALEIADIPGGLDYPYTAGATKWPIHGLRVTGDPRIDRSVDQLADDFLSQGVESYVERVWAEYEQMRAGDQLIFNITGSYKGLVPIARDVSLLLAGAAEGRVTCELCYLFETGSALIRYPALPMSLRGDDAVRADLDLIATTPGGVGPDLLKTRGEGMWAALFEPIAENRLGLSSTGVVMRALLRYSGSSA